MNFSEFLIALRARRKAFAITLAAVIMTAVAVALVVPKKYVANATLLMDVRDEQQMTPGRLLRDRGYLTTQMELIRSGRVAGQVVRDLKLAAKPGVREAWEQATGGAIPIEDWLATGLIDKLRVDVVAGNVLNVQFSSSDPKHASAVANGFAKAYLDTALSLRTEPTREAASWFEGQLKSMRSQLTQAQTKVASFQKEKGITSTEERSDIEVARLDTLSGQYSTARNATYEAIAKHKQALELVKSGIDVDAMPEVLSSGHIGSLKLDLARVEQRLDQEGTVLGENHPQYLRSKAEIQAINDKIAHEVKKLVAGL
ncbi:MAG TPA: Wzz/FepE/Etk N-terminal domain-containing protein, partial [Burkholderiales bacterium]|nr:Wzz/FepE/Etk N-terminal domain-containing protein [Burkholderiales bacterium]